jgi:hypothetical protein
MTDTQRISKYTIIDGPGDHALIDSYRTTYNDQAFRVWFTVDDVLEIEVRITALKHEDGSGHSHLFEGFVTGTKAGRVKSSMFRGWYVRGWIYTRPRGRMRPRHGYMYMSRDYIPDSYHS